MLLTLLRLNLAASAKVEWAQARPQPAFARIDWAQAAAVPVLAAISWAQTTQAGDVLRVYWAQAAQTGDVLRVYWAQAIAGQSARPPWIEFSSLWANIEITTTVTPQRQITTSWS